MVNRRIVHLRHDASGLSWAGDAPVNAAVVTSLDTDRWGNLYAAAPHENALRKFNPALEPVASLSGSLARPTAVHIPFFNVNDHRTGTLTRVGQPNAISVDQWSGLGGVRLWDLGVAIDGLAVVGGDTPSAHFTLTDQANLTLEVEDAADGHRLTSRGVGAMSAGVHDLMLLPGDLAGASGPLVLRVTAISPYGGASPEIAQAAFQVSGGGVMLPTHAVLLGNWPNPAQPATRIGFILPASDPLARLAVFDAAGRRVRSFTGGFSAGLNQVSWDGSDDGGARVRAGLYFYRLETGRAQLTRRLVVVR